MPLYRHKGRLYIGAYGSRPKRLSYRSSSRKASRSLSMFKRRKVSFKKASRKSYSSGYGGRVRKRGFGGRRSFRRRYSSRGSGGRGSQAAVNALIRKWQSRSRGVKGRGPLDQFISTGLTRAATIDPDTSDIVASELWGNGADIGSMLTNIRSEASSTLIGGAVLYQPALRVYGYATIDLVAAGNTDVTFEFVIWTLRGANSVTTMATYATNFAASWSQSYDARPTGFEAFPDTSLLQNIKWWGKGSNNNIKATRRLVVKVRVGKPKRLFFKFKTRQFNYDDYAQSTFLTEGMAAGKSYAFFMKCHGERGQVCGTLSAVNQPILTELGSPYMIKVRQYYFYRWLPGNNRPTIYGSNLGPNEAVNEAALQWVGVNALKSQRYAAANDVFAAFPDWGGQDVYSKHEANINPIRDCAADALHPTVVTA